MRVDAVEVVAGVRESSLTCLLCDEFTDPAQPSARVVWRDDSVVVAPALGCFTQGYCLMLPVEHVSALSELDPRVLERVHRLAYALRGELTDAFGHPVILAEHGAGQCDPGASCVDHAHLHLIPVESCQSVVEAFEAVRPHEGELNSLRDLEALRGTAYVYLSPTPDVHLCWEAHGFTRQFARRICASQLGVGEFFDWREYPFPEVMADTCNIMWQRDSCSRLTAASSEFAAARSTGDATAR